LRVKTIAPAHRYTGAKEDHLSFSLEENRAGGSQLPVVVVSGLPRSGTSMAMRMLEAGGLPIFTDRQRLADEDNPKGYYELERVKKLGQETDRLWLREAQGKGIKIVSHLLTKLPPDLLYKVVFMNRAIEEVVASQNKMLERRGQTVEAGMDRRVAALFEQHLREVRSWLAARANLKVMYLDYADIVRYPEAAAQQMCGFIGLGLEWRSMAQAVDPALYRNRLAPA